MNIYQEELMDHYRNPRHKGCLENPDFASGEHNPSCGDSIALQGRISDGILTNLSFDGKGCVISQATASMLCAALKNQTIQKVMALDAAYVCSLIGIDLGPLRLQCAFLSLHALQKGIKTFMQEKGIEHA